MKRPAEHREHVVREIAQKIYEHRGTSVPGDHESDWLTAELIYDHAAENDMQTVTVTSPDGTTSSVEL